jgi:hypothetical protein
MGTGKYLVSNTDYFHSEHVHILTENDHRGVDGTEMFLSCP